MPFGISLKPVKEAAPIAIGAGIVEPLADSLVARFAGNQPVFMGVGLDDIIVGGAALMFAKKKGFVGGIAKGVLVAKISKIATPLFSGFLGNATQSTASDMPEMI